MCARSAPFRAVLVTACVAAAVVLLLLAGQWVRQGERDKSSPVGERAMIGKWGAESNGLRCRLVLPEGSEIAVKEFTGLRVCIEVENVTAHWIRVRFCAPRHIKVPPLFEFMLVKSGNVVQEPFGMSAVCMEAPVPWEDEARIPPGGRAYRCVRLEELGATVVNKLHDEGAKLRLKLGSLSGGADCWRGTALSEDIEFPRLLNTSREGGRLGPE